MKNKFKSTIIAWISFIVLIAYSAFVAYLKFTGSEAFNYFSSTIFYLAPISILMGALAFFVTSRDIKKAGLWYDKSCSNVAGILSATCNGFSTWFLVKGIYFVLALFVISKGQIRFINILAALGAFIVYLIGWIKTPSNKFKLIGIIPFLIFLAMVIESLIKA